MALLDSLRPSLFLAATQACPMGNSVMFVLTSCSTYIIVCMTFDRFYGIIRPHKAVYMNTVSRARTTIICIVIFSIVFNLPHYFLSSTDGKICFGLGAYFHRWFGKLYYLLNLVVNFAVPFLLLLIMNSFIINTIRTRAKRRTQRNLVIDKNIQTLGVSRISDNTERTDSVGVSYSVFVNDAQTACQTHSVKVFSDIQNTETKQPSKRRSSMVPRLKNSDRQVYIILLLVTFTFLILYTPLYVLFLYEQILNYTSTPKSFAEFILFHSVVQKLMCTNSGINFFLYVLSGGKFRRDLLKMFGCLSGPGKNSWPSESSDQENNSNQAGNRF